MTWEGASLKSLTTTVRKPPRPSCTNVGLSVLIRRYNAVAILGTFAHTTPEDEISTFQVITV